MAKVKILFSRKNDPFSLAIRFFTWSNWSHVDYIIGEDVIGATILKGVRKIPLNKQKRLVSNWQILEFECQDKPAMDNAMCSIVGRPYDIGAIFGFIIRSNWQSSSRWFCSEAIAWASYKGKTPLVSGIHHRVTPRDLLLSPLLKIIKKKE